MQVLNQSASLLQTPLLNPTQLRYYFQNPSAFFKQKKKKKTENLHAWPFSLFLYNRKKS